MLDSKSGQKDEIRNLHRNLKIQNNLIVDENMRLKTRLQSMATEMQRNEMQME